MCLVRRRPRAFALLGRDTQRVWGLGKPLYLDKIHIIALFKEARNELINLDIVFGLVSGRRLGSARRLTIVSLLFVFSRSSLGP